MIVPVNQTSRVRHEHARDGVRSADAGRRPAGASATAVVGAYYDLEAPDPEVSGADILQQRGLTNKRVKVATKAQVK